MDNLLHWPPRCNPDYESESSDALSAWDCARRMDRLADEANQLHIAAYDLYDKGDIDGADKLIDEHDRKWGEWTRLKHELSDIEGGF
jgi:hypothetical protein